MAAKPLSKTKIVSHMAEKVGSPKKTAALFFDELFKLAVKEVEGWRRQIRHPRHRPRREGAPQGAHGPQPANGRSDQDQGEDRGSPAPVEGVQRRHSEVTIPAFSTPRAQVWTAGFRRRFLFPAAVPLALCCAAGNNN